MGLVRCALRVALSLQSLRCIFSQTWLLRVCCRNVRRQQCPPQVRVQPMETRWIQALSMGGFRWIRVDSDSFKWIRLFVTCRNLREMVRRRWIQPHEPQVLIIL